LGFAEPQGNMLLGNPWFGVCSNDYRKEPIELDQLPPLPLGFRHAIVSGGQAPSNPHFQGYKQPNAGFMESQAPPARSDSQF
jgi:hypothetical protein